MEKITTLISEENIEKRINEIAEMINKDLKGEEVVALVLLKGAFIFAADIVRKLDMAVEIDFVQLSSYGDGTISKGSVDVTKNFSVDIANKNVLIIEDIIDTGNTLYYFKKELEKKSPKDVKICVLLDKKERRTAPIGADYVCFDIPDEFVVGYGLDYAQRYRELPFIGRVEKE